MAEKIDARYLNEKIKMGWTTANFTEHYGCSQESFEHSVKVTFSEKSSEDLLRRIQKNNERAEKQLKRRAQSASAVGQKERKDTKTLLKEAETAEAQVQTRIDKLKAVHENLETKQMNLEEGLTRQEEKIACIRESLKMELQNKEAIIAELKKASGNLKSVQDKLSNQYDRMKSIKEQKAKLMKVEILAYKDGTLEIESIDQIQLPKEQEGWKEVLSKLMEQKEADMISVGELKMLSKLVVLAAQLKAEERIFEITFENELTQELFNMIMC